MTTQKMPWFRMYTDFLNDPKMIALAFEDQRHFIGILALKSDGALEAEVEDSLMDRIVAQRLWIDHGVIREVKKRLVASGLIDANWQPLAWDKRQFKSDKDGTAAERQRRFREAKQANALRNAPVTRLETETEAEAETDKKAAPVGADASPVVLQVPLVDGTEHWVTQADIEGWSPAYPGIDVAVQLHKARVWLEENPKKRKTRAGIGRFLTGWLARSQDSGKDYAKPVRDSAIGAFV